MRESKSFFFNYRHARFLKILHNNARLAKDTIKPVHEIDVKKIAVLFDASIVEDKDLIFTFAKNLEKTGAKVTLMGYLDHQADTSGLHFKNFNNSDRSFFFIPKNYDVDRFLEVKYDILINADLSQSLSLHYLAVMASAHLKVGPYSDLSEYYHLLLETKDTFIIKQYIRDLIDILNKVCFHGKLSF
ncbi:MAG: hypothetical protein IPL56_08280 [Saprospiraceae bacterium]|nr:hypothetical protein [Saprospiraceae bacterium]